MMVPTLVRFGRLTDGCACPVSTVVAVATTDIMSVAYPALTPGGAVRCVERAPAREGRAGGPRGSSGPCAGGRAPRGRAVLPARGLDRYASGRSSIRGNVRTADARPRRGGTMQRDCHGAGLQRQRQHPRAGPAGRRPPARRDVPPVEYPGVRHAARRPGGPGAAAASTSACWTARRRPAGGMGVCRQIKDEIFRLPAGAAADRPPAGRLAGDLEPRGGRRDPSAGPGRRSRTPWPGCCAPRLLRTGLSGRPERRAVSGLRSVRRGPRPRAAAFTLGRSRAAPRGWPPPCSWQRAALAPLLPGHVPVAEAVVERRHVVAAAVDDLDDVARRGRC